MHEESSKQTKTIDSLFKSKQERKQARIIIEF